MTSEPTVPRNLRGRFRGFVEVGGVRDGAFQHFKIALSTLNPGVQYTVRFVQYIVSQLVKYCPGSILACGIEWLSRSDLRAGCVNGLVGERLPAMPETWVRVLVWKSSKKSSKSEKIQVRDPRRRVYRSPVQFTVLAGLLAGRLASILYVSYSILYAVRRSVCSVDLRPSK